MDNIKNPPEYIISSDVKHQAVKSLGIITVQEVEINENIILGYN